MKRWVAVLTDAKGHWQWTLIGEHENSQAALQALPKMDKPAFIFSEDKIIEMARALFQPAAWISEKGEISTTPPIAVSTPLYDLKKRRAP